MISKIKLFGLIKTTIIIPPAIAFLFIAIIPLAGQISASPEPEPIKIALIMAVTGIAAEDNAPVIQMAELAVDEINDSKKLDRRLKIIILDNQSTPIGSKSAAEKAVELNVTAVIGASWSSHSMAVAPVLQAAEIPMISPNSTNDAITMIGDYIFRICFTDSFQGRVLAGFAYSELNVKNAVILKNIHENYSMTLSEKFTEYFTGFGGDILWEGSYSGKTVDFSEILSVAKQLDPEMIFIPGYSRDSGLIIKQADKIGIKSMFLGGDGWDGALYEYAGNSCMGAHYSTHWHRDVNFPRNRHMLKQFQTKFPGQSISNEGSVLGYDAIHLLADALARSKSIDHATLRDNLAKTKNYPGACGNITFDNNGDPLNKEVIIIKFENNAINFVKSVKPL